MTSDPGAVRAALSRVVAHLSAGEARPGQVEMAVAVATALERGTHVAVSAGTGTGKSLGYLVPAVLSGKHVVVATATKGLQDQLSTKDLPAVAAGLDQKFSWAVLKGRSNYLCAQRISEAKRFGEQEQLELGAADGKGRTPRKPRAGSVGDQVVRLMEWAEVTKSGDRAELGFEPSPQAWSSVSVGADECPGAGRCEKGADCFSEKARARAGLADVTVVNHHLLGADLRNGRMVLPEHDALIVDEAHELEDILAASLGVDVGAGRLRGVAAGARGALGLAKAGSSDVSAVDDVMDTAVRYESILAATPEMRLPEGLGSELGDVVALLVARLSRVESALRKAGGAGAAPDVAQRCLRAQLGVERCREELQTCLEAGASTVVWVAGGDHPRLRSAPLDVRSAMAGPVFSEMPVVMTSATMAPGLALRLGADPAEVTELDVGSPFDFQANGLIYCAVDLPDRRRSAAAAEAALDDELEALIVAAEGRTLGLFTSYRAMTRAADALRGRVPWPIHVQGDLPKPALVEAFATEEASCLFATMGFWQGVDVPGATLSLVVIDKLPFPRPDDPLMAARRDAAGADGFRAVDLPRAATLLAQGAGRLIRTATDRGLVAVLDPRLAKASYSGYIVRALPKMRRTRDRAEAVAWLKQIAAERSATAPAPGPALAPEAAPESASAVVTAGRT